jgi:hypothetical protein
MGALLALIPVISGLISGGSIGAVLGGLSLADWIGLAGSLADAEPAVVVAVQALHPAFDKLIEDISRVGPAHAGTASWKMHQPQFIDGYLADGSVGQVPNPDFLAG